MVRTGKGGRYRYYACASYRLKGAASCGKPTSIPEGQLDRLVMGALADRLLTPARLSELLQKAQAHRRSTQSGNLQRRAELRKRLKSAETQIDRLYRALAEGTVDDTASFRTNLNRIEAEREECIGLLSQLDTHTPALRQALSKQQATGLAASLKRRLLDAPKPLQRRYVHGLVSEIVVDRDKAIISGPHAAIAAAVTSGALDKEVRTFVREWRPQGESNPCFSLERAAS